MRGLAYGGSSGTYSREESGVRSQEVRLCPGSRVRGLPGLILVTLLLPGLIEARKFLRDDPILQDPAPIQVGKIKSHKINEYYDFFQQTFFEPDKPLKHAHQPRPSAGINTLGDVPDSAWFTNRMGTRQMSMAELVRGPGDSHAPSMNGPWTVNSGKNEGITPGLVITDSEKRKYVLKFDPKSNPEMASAVDVIGSRFFHALGYNVPENYIVYFTRKQLALSEKSKFVDY